MLGTNYNGYENSLLKLEMENLSDRRKNLCLKFAQKCVKNPKTAHMFSKNVKKHNMELRMPEYFKVQTCKHRAI